MDVIVGLLAATTIVCGIVGAIVRAIRGRQRPGVTEEERKRRARAGFWQGFIITFAILAIAVGVCVSVVVRQIGGG